MSPLRASSHNMMVGLKKPPRARARARYSVPPSFRIAGASNRLASEQVQSWMAVGVVLVGGS
jgi:hypothetical protein